MDPIEVEVVEIDGQAPPPRPASAETRPSTGDDSEPRAPWQHWTTAPRRIHPIWWPLILIAGGILLVLALTVGLVLGAAYLIIRTVFRLLRALFA